MLLSARLKIPVINAKEILIVQFVNENNITNKSYITLKVNIATNNLAKYKIMHKYTVHKLA